jgi:predicted AAA+ superfamily ATPase
VRSTTDSTSYRRRLVDDRLQSLLDAFPAILINGPRAAGKTTTARQHVAGEVRLDQPAQAAAFVADPDAALRDRAEPLLIDEWQEVPDVLGAVKRAVDDDPTPGRFVLTGSVRTDLEARMWPGTGRLIRLRMYGLTEREILGVGSGPSAPFVETLAAADPTRFDLPAARPDLRDYVELAVRGGFPAAVLNVPAEHRGTWISSYLDQLVTRDAPHLVGGADPRKLESYFHAVAASSAGLPEHKTLYDAAAIDRRTADRYDDLLDALFVTERVPAWTANHLDRLVKTPKRYVVDPALMAASLAATADTLLASADLLGRAIDTFVMAQLRPEIALMDRVRLHHARTKGGREEVDIVIELPGNRLLGLEIKATAAPKATDARHLRWLRDENPTRFVAGAVLHTGPDVIAFDDDIFAVPICAFWG